MKTVIPDASVVVKWFVPEKHHKHALSIRDRYINGEFQLTAPDLLPYEVLNALHYTDLFDEGSLEKAADSIVKFGIDLVPYAEIEGIARRAHQFQVTVYDAAYLSLIASGDHLLYTSDETLLRAVDDADATFEDRLRHIKTVDDDF